MIRGTPGSRPLGSVGFRWLIVLALLAPSAAWGRVFLVGLDGASWNVIDGMVASGELPAFAKILAEGRSAELETVEPVISPVVWTSIATGRSPEVHGVTDFYATRLRVTVPSVFERLAARGLRVGLYDYLVTWPPEVLPGGFMIPGWLRRDDRITPADAWQRAERSPFVVEYEGLKTNADYLAMSSAEVSNKAERWLALAQAFDLDLGAVTFYTLDMRSHRFWRAAFPEDFEESGPAVPLEIRHAIADGYRGMDEALTHVRAALGPADALLIASDHGFRARQGGPRPVWVTRLAGLLQKADLEPERDGFRIVSEFGVVSIRIHPGTPERFAERDAVLARWVSLLESYLGPDGEPLFDVYALDIASRPPGAERPWTERVWQWAVRQALRFVFDVQLDPGAHAVLIARPDAEGMERLWPDGRIQVLGEERPLADLMSRQEFSGEHDPLGILLAVGGPIRSDPARDRVSVLDLAPLLFYLAGLPIPDDLEGTLPEGWIEPGYLAAHPPRSAPAGELPGFSRPAGPAPGSDAALTEKLRALGYIE